MTRLIDADELKVQIPTIEDEYKYVHKLIDSAPTVNFTISPDYVTELQNINKELIKQLEETRPQGEWIKCGWSIRCSICNYDMPYTVRNFCPNCGADMRKGEENEQSEDNI